MAAVDFDDNILISGFENSNIVLWTINDAQFLRKLTGHNGGITGVKLNGQYFATSSYDGSVRLWTIEGENLAVFEEPSHLLRCIGFTGNNIIGNTCVYAIIHNVKNRQITTYYSEQFVLKIENVGIWVSEFVKVM